MGDNFENDGLHDTQSPLRSVFPTPLPAQRALILETQRYQTARESRRRRPRVQVEEPRVGTRLLRAVWIEIPHPRSKMSLRNETYGYLVPRNSATPR